MSRRLALIFGAWAGLSGCSHDWTTAPSDASMPGLDAGEGAQPMVVNEAGSAPEGGAAPSMEAGATSAALKGPSVSAGGSCVEFTLSDPRGALEEERSVTLSIVPASAARIFADARCAESADRVSLAKRSASTRFYLQGALPTGEVTSRLRVRVSGAISAEQPLELRRAAIDVAVGDGFVCAVLDDGALYCWGDARRAGGAARGDLAGVPVRVNLGDERAQRVVAGTATGCVLTQSGKVLCWGESTSAQAQTESAPSLVPKPLPELTQGVTDLCVGPAHGCAVREGALLCWGQAHAGQAGAETSVMPARHPDFAGGVSQVACGFDHTCVTLQDGAVRCFGARGWTLPAGGRKTVSSGFDQALCVLRDGAVQCRGKLSPELDWGEAFQRISGLSDGVSALAVGSQHACAIKAGSVYCMGSNTDANQSVHGALGSDRRQLDSAAVIAPEALHGEATAISVSHTYPWLKRGTSCAIAGGLVSCWGANLYGELGDSPALRARALPERVPLLDALNVDALYLPAVESADYGCALSAGKVYCWGLNCDGPLGEPKSCFMQAEAKPSPIALPGAVSTLSLGAGFACALVLDQVYCWGMNDRLQAGAVRGAVNRIELAGRAAIDVAAGSRHACALVRESASEQSVMCWGEHSAGRLGDAVDDGNAASAPVKVALASSHVRALSSAIHDTCALVDEGVQCWGPGWGVTESGATTFPVRWAPGFAAGAIRGISDLKVAGDQSCVLNEGNVACFHPWSTPERRASDVMQLRVGAEQLCGLGRDGALSCAGANESGQLGRGDFARAAAYSAVSGLSPPIKAFATGGGRHAVTCARDAQGVKCWGSNLGRLLGWAPTHRIQPALIAPWDAAEAAR